MKPKPKIGLPRTEMTADEFIDALNNSVFAETEEERRASADWLLKTKAEIERNRRRLLGPHAEN